MLQKQKLTGQLRILILTLLSISALLFIGEKIYENRIVATIDGNTIYYNGSEYEEVFEVFEIEMGNCLGTLERQDKSKCKIYRINEKPEYIYVSLFIDHQIYKKIN